MRAEPAAPVPPLAGLVNAFERMSGAYLTIHDVRGIITLQESDRLLPGRFLHSSPWCRRDRFERSAWNNLCTFDCKTSVYEELRKKAEPFVKVCWKGVLEVVVPVISRGRIMLVLYAGVFRRPGQTEPESLTVLPEYYARSFLLLPELSPEREKELVAGLTLLGNALLQELEAIDVISKSGSREQKILQFLNGIRILLLLLHTP